MAAPRALRAASAALLLFTVNASAVVESSRILGANPIRKVVTLMQNMQKEIEAEGEKEKELFEKFMCYCQNNGGDLSKSIADAKAKASELAAKLKAEVAEKSSTAQELIDHKKDREAATKDLAEATAIREKEKAESEETTTDMQTNIDAMQGQFPPWRRAWERRACFRPRMGTGSEGWSTAFRSPTRTTARTWRPSCSRERTTRPARTMCPRATRS
jgi:hypothetical protein